MLTNGGLLDFFEGVETRSHFQTRQASYGLRGQEGRIDSYAQDSIMRYTGHG